MKKLCYITTISLSIKSFFVPQLKYLANNGFDVTVVCSKDDELAKILGENIRYIPIEIPRGISFGGSIKAINELRKLFRQEKFDLVQYSTPNAAFYASIASKKEKVKVRNYHLMGLRYLGANGLGRFLLKTLEKIACKNSTHIECVSQSNLELAIKEKLFPKNKGVVVHNGSTGGLDLQRFDVTKRESYRSEIRKKYGLTEDEFVFGFVGRITKDKGVNEILTAFYKLNNAKLLMVGRVEDDKSLDKELYEKSLKDSNVIYTGLVKNVEAYYSAMDVLLFPSYREGFGNVVMEAGAMGTTSIISNIPGPIDEVIDGETALVVTVKDSDSLFSAMKRIMDKKECEIMAKNARKYVAERFNQDILNKHILARKKMLLGIKD